MEHLLIIMLESEQQKLHKAGGPLLCLNAI